MEQNHAHVIGRRALLTMMLTLLIWGTAGHVTAADRDDIKLNLERVQLGMDTTRVIEEMGEANQTHELDGGDLVMVWRSGGFLGFGGETALVLFEESAAALIVHSSSPIRNVNEFVTRSRGGAGFQPPLPPELPLDDPEFETLNSWATVAVIEGRMARFNELPTGYDRDGLDLFDRITPRMTPAEIDELLGDAWDRRSGLERSRITWRQGDELITVNMRAGALSRKRIVTPDWRVEVESTGWKAENRESGTKIEVSI